ncbi:peroxisomal bifunctional enzyme isoform X1 [Alosa sapidissima]|uniref:peroxisomal bifunctional enzyme isoform X1 n=2 Tax=Alosa sapidissima TaxID=34773 RepID=UPI001C08D6D6|nr:peroxisomal bifunctional enzyme isoform X1 [Alosa sapidissima]
MARYAQVQGSVALITLTNPPVNALSAAVRLGITEAVTRALRDPKVKSVVICGENGVFCGGADIREFAKPMTGPPLVPMISAIEEGDKPVVAAIEGMAFGGGLELALGCHYRIAHSKARVGLPEVTLGLLPAAGGTQRLPRLIGLAPALELITTGRHVTAQEALKHGIVDKVTDQSAQDLAIQFAQEVVGQPLLPRKLSTQLTPCPPDVDTILDEAMARVKQRARGAMAPVACVQAVRAAVNLPYQAGMQKEQELMAFLFRSSQARALQYCFFAQRAVGKWSLSSGAHSGNSKPRPVTKAAVIGLGTMGRGITVALVKAGLSVVAVETNKKQLEMGKQMVSAMLKHDAQKMNAVPRLDLLHYTTDLSELKNTDLIIEAVFEDMALKKEVFKKLSSVCKPDAVLCTNTSGLDVDELASVTKRPELVVGMHFFAPAHVMKLLEVVRGSRSSPEVMATAMHLGKRLGKVSVVVGNCSGFVGNRMLRPYLDQANFLLEEGATPELVDGALEEFGFPMGVFKVSDLSGLDVGWRIRKEAGLTGPNVDPKDPSRRRQGHRYSPLPDLVCEQGRLGQKSGRGWYLYDKPGGRVATPDPDIHKLLEDYRVRHGIRPRQIGSQEVLERCLFALINEGFRVLEDGMATGPEGIDMIYVFGYGWPRHRGGPMFYAAMVGLPRVLERLEYYQQVHPDVPHLQPSSLLRRLVVNGSPPLDKWRDFLQRPHSQL